MKKKYNIKKLHNLYLDIWKERGPYSEVSGVYLGKEPLSIFFDHLLEKSKYPELIFERRNIILVTADEQTQRTNGFPSEKHQEFIDKAKIELL